MDQQSIHRLRAKVFLDGVIYRDQLWAIANGLSKEILRTLCRCRFQDEAERCSSCGKQIGDGPWESGVLVLLPLMLGVKVIEGKYHSLVKTLLKMSETVGIIGGTTRSALYFVGFQHNSLIYLDPHIVKPAIHSDDELASNLDSFVCTKARLLPLSKAKSSMSVGFYFNSHESFNSFQRVVDCMKGPLQGLVSVVNSSPQSVIDDGLSLVQAGVEEGDNEFARFD